MDTRIRDYEDTVFNSRASCPDCKLMADDALRVRAPGPWAARGWEEITLERASTAEPEDPTVDDSTSTVADFDIDVKDMLGDALNGVYMTIAMVQERNDAQFSAN
jgi:hypothetical protein